MCGLDSASEMCFVCLLAHGLGWRHPNGGGPLPCFGLGKKRVKIRCADWFALCPSQPFPFISFLRFVYIMGVNGVEKLSGFRLAGLQKCNRSEMAEFATAHDLNHWRIIRCRNLWRLRTRASKICCSLRTKKEKHGDAEKETGQKKSRRRMQNVADGVVSEPNDEKPARPIATPKHEYAADDCENRADVNESELKWVLRSKLGEALIGCRVNRR